MTAFIDTLVYHLISPPLSWLHRSGACSTLLAMRGCERLRWRIGRLGAWIRFQSTRRSVPAYREFLSQHPTARSAAALDLSEVPATDKANYVKAFSLNARCTGGRLPTRGIIVDESSGSSGLPTNWVRGTQERKANRRTIRMGLEYRFGRGPLYVINAFALGSWATGINLTMALAPSCRIKSTGPDLAKIENTLQQFGDAYEYVIMGYPPFLKQVVDCANVEWRKYRVSMIFGGEGMSESMRRYLQDKGITRVYGSYGASDLELNIGAETDLTIALRRLLENRPALAARFLQHHGAMPMIFQFNPADFFIETNAEGELIVTICRPGYVSPKVRYNIHDLGHVMRIPELVSILASEGVDAKDLAPGALDLPLLFLYGRSDASVAYYGCKIPPADVQESLFRLPALARQVDAFQLHTFEDGDGDKRLVVRLEVPAGGLPEGPDAWVAPLFDTIADVNQDFRASRRMAPKGKDPSIEFHQVGTGPFAGADIRIKREYLDRGAA